MKATRRRLTCHYPKIRVQDYPILLRTQSDPMLLSRAIDDGFGTGFGTGFGAPALDELLEDHPQL
jgi:hypothetical protein